jgi:hypothetical protein
MSPVRPVSSHSAWCLDAPEGGARSDTRGPHPAGAQAACPLRRPAWADRLRMPSTVYLRRRTVERLPPTPLAEPPSSVRAARPIALRQARRSWLSSVCEPAEARRPRRVGPAGLGAARAHWHVVDKMLEVAIIPVSALVETLYRAAESGHGLPAAELYESLLQLGVEVECVWPQDVVRAAELIARSRADRTSENSLSPSASSYRSPVVASAGRRWTSASATCRSADGPSR